MEDFDVFSLNIDLQEQWHGVHARASITFTRTDMPMGRNGVSIYSGLGVTLNGQEAFVQLKGY